MYLFRYMALLWLLPLLFMISCATVVMPSGGARDAVPPRVLSTSPENNSIRFSGNTISITFDEFIELGAVDRNILISPYISEKPFSFITGKKLVLKYPSGFLPNKTYSIQLGSGLIRDFNEGNTMPSYRFKINTGENIDSGKLSAVIVDRKATTRSSEILFVLVKNKSDFHGKNYSYIARSDNGSIMIDNLNNEEYYGFAFVDSNQNMKWDKNELVGFSKSKFSSGISNPKIELFPVQNEQTSFILTAVSNNEYLLTTSQDIQDLQLEDKTALLIPINSRSFKIINSFLPSSGYYTLVYNQSQRDTVKLPLQEKTKNIQILDLAESSRDLNSYLPDTVDIPFNSFISKVNFQKIKLKKDTTIVAIQPLIVENKIRYFGLEYGVNYSLFIDSQAIYFASYTNRKPLTVLLNMVKLEEVKPEITIELDSAVANKPHIIYIIKKGIPQRLSPFKTMKMKNVKEENLSFQIILDQNKNGKWDTGSIEQNRYPEPYYIETIKLDSKTKNYTLKITNL